MTPYDERVATGALRARARRFVDGPVDDLVHPTTPLGRLARTHVLMVSGDTLVTVALAGSLFFSISPDAARSQVLLYLVLTMAPFIVVAPLLSPLLDRTRAARRTMVILSALVRAVLCLLMARDLHSLVLFPEAFLVLIASKTYTVTKASLVPGTVDSHHQLVGANSHLSLLSGLSAIVAGGVGAAMLSIPGLGSAWVLRLDAVVLVGGALAASTLLVRQPAWLRKSEPEARRTDTGVLESRPHASTTAGWDPGTSELAGDTAARPGVRAGRGATEGRGSGSAGHRQGQARRPAGLRHGGRHLLFGAWAPLTLVAATAMAVLRGGVGYLIFLVAFNLRDAHAPLYIYGAALVASAGGNLVATRVAPRLRRHVREDTILVASLLSVVVASVAVAAAGGGDWPTIGLAAVMGLAAGCGKVSFDALVQRDAPELHQGRAFGRFESRFQLAWVLGALIPVVAAISLRAGSEVLAFGMAVAAASFMAARNALDAQRRPSPPVGPTG